jgi:hypothetical protein
MITLLENSNRNRKGKEAPTARERKGKTISLYFNKDDLVLFNFIEQYSEKNKIAKGKVIIQMLKSLGFMCAFSDYWARTTKKKIS